MNVFGLWEETRVPAEKPTQAPGKPANCTQKDPAEIQTRNLLTF